MAAGLTAVMNALLVAGTLAGLSQHGRVPDAEAAERIPNRATICAGAAAVSPPDEAGLSLAEQCRSWLPDGVDADRATGAIAALLAHACRLGYWDACGRAECAVCGPLTNAAAVLAAADTDTDTDTDTLGGSQ